MTFAPAGAEFPMAAIFSASMVMNTLRWYWPDFTSSMDPQRRTVVCARAAVELTSKRRTRLNMSLLLSGRSVANARSAPAICPLWTAFSPEAPQAGILESATYGPKSGGPPACEIEFLMSAENACFCLLHGSLHLGLPVQRIATR